MDGRSLIPVANQPGIERGRALLIEEPSFKAIRTERYMYAEHRGGAKELYDLNKDPFELRSRHADPATTPSGHSSRDACTSLGVRRRQLPDPFLAVSRGLQRRGGTIHEVLGGRRLRLAMVASSALALAGLLGTAAQAAPQPGQVSFSAPSLFPNFSPDGLRLRRPLQRRGR